MNLDSSGLLDNQLVFKLVYEDNNGKSESFRIGSGKNEVSFELLNQILSYARTGKADSNSFSSLVAAAKYNSYSEEEKEILALIELDRNALKGSRIILEMDDAEADTSILQKMPTQSYLNSVKNQEELDFKVRELKKFYWQMDKMRGILPMNEMMNEFKGTNIQLSNIHITDMERLNDMRVHSPVF